MATPEGIIKNKILLALRGLTFWNNPTGKAVPIPEAKKPCQVCGARPHISQYISYGLPGSADIIGVTPVTITADMVGQTIGVFTGIEVKTAKNTQQKNQCNFQAAVERNSGIYIVARSETDVQILTGGKP